MSTTEIVLIAVGTALGLLLIILIVVTALFFTHRRRSAAASKTTSRDGRRSSWSETSQGSSGGQFPFLPGVRPNYLLWQSGGSIPRMYSDRQQQYRHDPYRQNRHRSPHMPPRMSDSYDEEKLRNISQAVNSTPYIVRVKPRLISVLYCTCKCLFLYTAHWLVVAFVCHIWST